MMGKYPNNKIDLVLPPHLTKKTLAPIHKDIVFHNTLHTFVLCFPFFEFLSSSNYKKEIQYKPIYVEC